MLFIVFGFFNESEIEELEDACAVDTLAPARDTNGTQRAQGTQMAQHGTTNIIPQGA